MEKYCTVATCITSLGLWGGHVVKIGYGVASSLWKCFKEQNKHIACIHFGI